MFGQNSRRNTYDDTSVMEDGGKEYGSDIHGVALRVNKTVWDMLKVLKEKKLFGFHFSAKVGLKNTVVIMTHKDRDMLNLGQKALHGFQNIDDIIILGKVGENQGSTKSVVIKEGGGDVPWKGKTGISTIIITLLLIAGGVYYILKQNQEKKKEPIGNNSIIEKKEVNIKKNIEINVEMMNTLSKSFDNKENKKVKEVLSKVLQISTSTDILEKIPGYEKVELDNDKIASAYEDPNLKYVIKDGNGTMRELNAMAQAYAKENNITEAKGILNELIKIGKEANKKGVKGHKDGVARNLNTLGDVSLQEGNITSAKNSFNEALQIDKKLAKKSPRRYNMRVARELTKLGAINIFLNNKERAERLYHEAEGRYRRIVELYRSLVKKKPDTFKPHLAYSLNNLANLYLQQEQNLSKAIEPSEEALAIYKKLDKTNPKKYSEFLALTEYKIASIYDKKEKFSIAQSRYNRVITYCKEQNSSKYQEHIAKSLNALAWIHTKQPTLRDFAKAKDELNEAIVIYKKLIKKNPKTFNSILSLSYSNLGYIAMIEEKRDRAFEMYKKALDIADNFDNRISYAIFLSKQKRYKDANRIFKSIIKKYSQKEEQAKALMSYGEFYINIDEEEGYRKLKNALILYMELSKKDKFSYLKSIDKIEKLLKK
ncbi:TPR repeat-containing protein [hydrothermal vent metagenome]|uniref:TPR repeat-containing protein n=1 Tax=hydrothermal vent metagenome TaxID=652676 RepID=A0A1W1CGR2_9ZZZZ